MFCPLRPMTRAPKRGTREALPSERQVELTRRLARLLARLMEAERDE